MKDFKKLFEIYISEAEIETPDWTDKSEIYDWKNYVDVDVKKIWKTLTLREKMIIFSYCDRLASKEDWD